MKGLHERFWKADGFPATREVHAQTKPGGTPVRAQAPSARRQSERLDRLTARRDRKCWGWGPNNDGKYETQDTTEKRSSQAGRATAGDGTQATSWRRVGWASEPRWSGRTTPVKASAGLIPTSLSFSDTSSSLLTLWLPQQLWWVLWGSRLLGQFSLPALAVVSALLFFLF